MPRIIPPQSFGTAAANNPGTGAILADPSSEYLREPRLLVPGRQFVSAVKWGGPGQCVALFNSAIAPHRNLVSGAGPSAIGSVSLPGTAPFPLHGDIVCSYNSSANSEWGSVPRLTSNFTVVWVGSVFGGFSSTANKNLLGQKLRETNEAGYTAYDWTFYESYAANALYFLVTNGTTNASLQLTADAIVSEKRYSSAVSFQSSGKVRGACNGIPATEVTASFTATTAIANLAFGGYDAGISSYDVRARVAVFILIKGWAATTQECLSLSNDPYQFLVLA